MSIWLHTAIGIALIAAGLAALGLASRPIPAPIRTRSPLADRARHLVAQDRANAHLHSRQG